MIQQLLDDLGLESVDKLQSGVRRVRRKYGSNGTPVTFILKPSVRDFELRLLTKVLPAIDQSRFKVLILPEVVDSGPIANGISWVLSTDYGKMKYDWSECNAGHSIPQATAASILALLQDFQSIDLSDLRTQVPIFEFNRWHDDHFRKNRAVLAKSGLLAESDISAAERVFAAADIKSESNTDEIFSNGDCQFRNFIPQSNGMIAVIDWADNPGIWIGPGIEPVENIAMYLWTLVWDNPTWQQDFLTGFRASFRPTDVQLRQALLIKSFNQGHFWQHVGCWGLARQQFEHFRRAMSDDWLASQ